MYEATKSDSDNHPEQWRAVPGYEGLYSVSDLGRVRSHNAAKGRILKPRVLEGTGYRAITLCRNGLKSYRHVAHLVLEAFVGPRPRGYHACHGNSIRTDNRLTNLRWDTASANALERVASIPPAKRDSRGWYAC